MTAPTPSRRSAAASFDLLTFLSVLITAGIGLGIAAYCSLHPSKSVDATTSHLMQYFGFIHFAVGYYFFFTSQTFRAQLRAAPLPVGSKLACCVTAGVLFYHHPDARPLVYTLFYLHAAENTVYHLFKLRQSGPGDHEGPSVAPATLFPLFAALVAARLSPAYLTHPQAPFHLAQLLLVALAAVWVRRLLPSTHWRAGSQVAVRYHVVIVAFFIVGYFFPEGSPSYDLFIIWHYVIWVLYTWMQKPTARPALVWSHVAFAAIYKILFLLDDRQLLLGHPAILPLLIGPVSFLAQTTWHILLSFAFREYPQNTPRAAARARRVALA